MRRQPVAFFLGDAAFLSDSKFRQLARRLPDPDEFNSAVGAYWIALAAARRNGLPALDIAQETGSRFLDDLRAVGLLGADGFPDKPFREWAPGRPRYASDARPAPSAPNVPSAPNGSESSEPSVYSASATSAPLPLPSLPITSTGRGPGEGLPNLNNTVAGIWEQATGRSVLASGDYAAGYLDDACRRHPPSEVGAAIIRARKAFDHIPDAAQLVAAMRPVLDPLPDRKQAAAAASSHDRRESGRAGLLVARHNGGQHADDPDPDCPTCRKAEVPA